LSEAAFSESALDLASEAAFSLAFWAYSAFTFASALALASAWSLASAATLASASALILDSA